MSALDARARSVAEVGPSTVPAVVPAVVLDSVTRVHHDGVRALDDVSVAVEPGEFLAVMGASGSGKSTLLQVAAGLDTPTQGSVRLVGREISGLDETARTLLRRDVVGFVFQSYNLLPALTVGENLTLPLRLAGRRPDRDRARHLLDRVGLAALVSRLPGELSGGQQQRAAIARALIARPAVVFADEPTGALDHDSAREVLNLLRELVTETGVTVIMVTHDATAAAAADRVLTMADGRVVGTNRASRTAALPARQASLGQG